MVIRSSIARYEEQLRRVRRELHRIPELSGQEYETHDYIKAFLEKLNPYHLETIFNTGLKAVFRGKGPGRVIGFRADIDGLSMEEKTGADYCSRHPGYMHACGHDGHTAIMLCLADMISKRREEIEGQIVFLFQPAEEEDGGAKPMIDGGALENPRIDELYGLHLWPYLPAGKFGIKRGPLMSDMRDLNVRIKGRSAHGARPQNGVDAIVAAGHFISQIQSIISRNTDPFETAVITLGRIQGGDARNIICDEVLIEGTIRTFGREMSEYAKKRVLDILKGLEAGMQVETEYFETMTFPAVINPEGLAEKALSKMREDELTPVEAVMMSEDFSFYQEATDALFVFLGTGEPGHDFPLHSNQFSFDEKYLTYGMEFMARMAGLNE